MTFFNTLYILVTYLIRNTKIILRTLRNRFVTWVVYRMLTT